MKEEFRDIPNYEGLYQVSNLGRIKSLARKNSRGIRVNEKILKTNINGSGYHKADLSRDGKTKTRTIHQLVAEAFLDHKPSGHRLVVNHINYNRQDNRLENLEIVTNRENSNLKHIKSSSEYVGVSWFKNSKKWVSKIRVNGNLKHLGYFTEELEAAKAYQDKLKTL